MYDDIQKRYKSTGEYFCRSFMRYPTQCWAQHIGRFKARSRVSHLRSQQRIKWKKQTIRDPDITTVGNLSWDKLYFSTDWHRSWNSQLMMDRIYSTREYYGLPIWDEKNPAFMKDPRHRIRIPKGKWTYEPDSVKDKHD